MIRAAALRAYKILETEPEPAYTDIAGLAARICGTPMAMVTFVDGDRVWIKARVGGDFPREVAVGESFCRHAIRSEGVMVVEDATRDGRFAGMAPVTGEPHLRFYAGAPLVAPGGIPIGMLCILDTPPRQLSISQREALTILSGQVLTLMELKRSQRRLRDLIGNIRDGLLTLDGEGRILFLNESAAAMLGVDGPSSPGRIFEELVGPAGDGRLMALFREAALSNSPGDTELAYEPTRRHLQIHAEPTAEGLTVTLRDVTQQRISEEQLRVLGTCISRLNDIVLITEADPIDEPGPRIVYVNHAFRRLTGYEKHEVIGKSPRFLQGPETQREVLKRIREAMEARRPCREELINYTKSGEAFWLEIEIVPVIDSHGKLTHFAAVERDITGRKNAEARLQEIERERRLADDRVREQARLLDRAKDAILVRDLEHRIIFWNKGAERLYGWSASEAEGRSIVELLYESGSTFETATREVLVSGAWSGEIEQVNREGKRILVEGSWTLMLDEAGNPKSILAINTDITERRALERQLLRNQRMDSLGTLAGGIAHDLNNVLTPIMMAVDLLKSDETNPERLDLLESVDSSARRGAEMVRQVLAFGRGVEGQRVDLDPGQLVHEIVKIAGDVFPRNLSVTAKVMEPLRKIRGDSTQLHQVLLNLAVNARDAMPDGGRLFFTVENEDLDEHYLAMYRDATPGPHVVVQVEDTGTGMSQEVVDRIFEPFFTTKEQGKGTGLGLSTSLAIVKSHGGFMRITSEPGQGTCFRLSFPAAAQGRAVDAVAAPEALRRGAGQTILVVDDETVIRDIARQTLEAYGYHVIVAGDGAEAVSLYAGNREVIDLVLTDMMMPVMAGPALIRVLRRLNPDVRIITASGLEAGFHSDNDPEIDGYAFLPKPYTAESLLREVAQALSGAG